MKNIREKIPEISRKRKRVKKRVKMDVNMMKIVLCLLSNIFALGICIYIKKKTKLMRLPGM